MGALRITVVVALALLAGAGPAHAAPGFLGTGHDPGVAVDRAGTAHVAWFVELPDGGAQVEYCQVPRGTRRCSVRRVLPLEAFGSGEMQVLVPRPGDTISLISGYGPTSFGRFNLDGSGGRELPVEFGEATESLDRSIAPFGPGLLVVFGGLASRSVIFNGAGDPNLQQNWVEGPRLGDDRLAPAAVGGRSGTYVAYVDRRGNRSDVRVRRLRGTRLRRAVRVSRHDPVTLAFAQGPRGDIALVFNHAGDAYVVRSRTGRRWTRHRRFVRGSEPVDLQTALGRRNGWMVWDGSGGNTGSNPIRIAAIPRPPRR